MLTITWLGHATTVIDLDGVRLITDPLLQEHAGVLRRRGPVPSAEQYVGADAVLLSHLHHDHAEVSSLDLLTDATVISTKANAAWAARATERSTVGLGPDDWFALTDDVAVHLTPAVHRARPMPHRPNDAVGHLVRGAEQTVWCAGDTELHDGLVQVHELAGERIDLALLPIGGWGPRLSAGHMGPEEAARACAMVGPRAVLPVHYGTLHPPGFDLRSLDWMTRPAAEFSAAMADIAPGVEVLIPSIGAPIEMR